MPSKETNRKSMGNIATVDVFSGAFAVTFQKDVGDLKAGSEIYLQLPNCPDSVHDGRYSEATTMQAIAEIKKVYTNSQLSYMSITNNSNVSDFEVVEVYSNKTGERVNILHDAADDTYYHIELSHCSDYYNVAMWRLHEGYGNEFGISGYTEAQLEYMFKNAVYVSTDFEV